MEDYKPLFILLAGLVLFLYALNKLADHLKEISDDKMKKVPDRFTSNPFSVTPTLQIIFNKKESICEGVCTAQACEWCDLFAKKKFQKI